MPLITLFITLVAFAASANAVSPLISTLASAIGVPASSFGFFITLQYVAFSLASFLGGAVKEKLRLTSNHLVAAGLLLISAAMFSGAVVLRSTAALVAWIIPLGLAGGLTETFASVQISALSAPGSSRNLTLSQVFYTIGAFAAPQIVSVLFRVGVDYRNAFLIFGGFSVAVLVFFLISAGKHGGLARTHAVTRGAQADAPAVRGPLFTVMILLMLGCVLMESVSASWLSYVFERRFSLLPKDSSMILVTFWLAMMAGRLIVVVLPARWTLWPTLTASTTGLLATGVLLVAASSLAAQWAGVALLGVFLGPLWPVIVMTASSSFHSEKLTSFIIGAGAIGSASGPLVGSLFVSQGWTDRFFRVYLSLAALVTVFCITGRRLRAGAAGKA